MALKKSELYSSLWASCDELRGGMDASQYKDYVLVLLFIKYVSDKYAGKPFAEITVPEGASFADMVALKGRADIGDQINKTIIAPLQQANHLSDMPDFNDPNKLGSGREMVDRLTNLIAIFEDPRLDFSRNRADGDDILGDAYEYLMRHFATESGKSKGQFYTPAEVSRIMASVIGIGEDKTNAQTTVYDPTCGSGSLLLKVADAANTSDPVTLYGQEKDSATAALSRMNMILHGFPGARIVRGNTLSDPSFFNEASFKPFDYVVANPPFSDKRWSTGFDPERDAHERFQPYGIPPAKQGDYAYLLHIVRSLKPRGKGACILPHGVLFRGNAEAAIRENLIRRGLIRAIIGLPANLFYGTGIPACIILIDKAGAAGRDSIFMLDASQGFYKDGPKNRLRARDIHRITDTVRQGCDVPRFARNVPFAEIEANGFNLNIPRYIDIRPPEDVHDLEAHMKGGIPVRDVEALRAYWQVCPGLKAALFTEDRPGYYALKPGAAAIRDTINAHPEFIAFQDQLRTRFAAWRAEAEPTLAALEAGCDPKQVITDLSESLLAHYRGAPLIDPYSVYQCLMDLWSDTMQDDLYTISADGWLAETYRIIETSKAGKEKDKGWACDLVPKDLIVARYFADEKAAMEARADEVAGVEAERAELEEEQGGEDGTFSELEKINKGEVKRRLKELANEVDTGEEAASLETWLALSEREARLKKEVKEAEAALDGAALATYPGLSVDALKTLIITDKWMANLAARIGGEVDQTAGALTRRVQALAARYDAPLPDLTRHAEALSAKVDAHLKAMGLSW